MTRSFHRLVSKAKYIGKSVPTSGILFGRQSSGLDEMEQCLVLNNFTKMEYKTYVIVLFTSVDYVYK